MRRKVLLCLAAIVSVTTLSLALMERAGAQGNTLTLQDAVARKLVNASLSGNGDIFFRQPASYRIQNLGTSDLSVIIQAGLLLTPTDSGAQQLVVAQDLTTTIRPGQTVTGTLWAYCTEETKHAPDSDTNFRIGDMAGGNLLKVAQLTNRRNYVGDLGAQLAVWRITNGTTLEKFTGGEGNSELISALRPLLGLAGDPFTRAESILQEAGTGLHYSEFGTPTPIQSPLPGNTNVNDILSFLRNLTRCCTCFGAFGGIFFLVFLRR